MMSLLCNKLKICYLFLKIYIFINFREEGGGRERDGNVNERESLIGCLLHAPHWGWSPQPGNRTVTSWFIGRCPTNERAGQALLLDLHLILGPEDLGRAFPSLPTESRSWSLPAPSVGTLSSQQRAR
uniref:Uncharacterized protein n=1 Tax=Myotis myotis TaxID=51298 RepID=A0A7J7TTP8_MYOMY|nr:hypothetical protein mMyoMyo1_008955 [Myotis myotis]